jgi:hypothetical protein
MEADDFSSPGIDYDIENHLVRQLNADHRYLHIGYLRLKQGRNGAIGRFPASPATTPEL